MSDTPDVGPGDAVQVRTAFGEWREARATSPVEATHDINPRTGRRRKIHDFPVIWVDFGVRGRPTPWPAEDVRKTGAR